KRQGPDTARRKEAAQDAVCSGLIGIALQVLGPVQVEEDAGVVAVEPDDGVGVAAEQVPGAAVATGTAELAEEVAPDAYRIAAAAFMARDNQPVGRQGFCQAP